MKHLIIFAFAVLFLGLQTAQAEVFNMGTTELTIVLLIAFFTISFAVGFIYLCLYFIKRSKSNGKEK